MRIVFGTLATAGVAVAFAPSSPLSAGSSATALNAELSRMDFVRAAAAATVGVVTASGNSLPALAEEKLDFSLPTYDSAMKESGGFGTGTEAYLNKSGSLSDPGSGEADKQKEAMRKAEEARQRKLEEKKAERKALEEETKRRALEKKAENERRMKGIF